MEENKINVLDKGYVRLVDVMGSDLSVVNAARASFKKEVDELTEKDIRLIKYLIKHNHNSVLRHAFATFEINAPLMISRQWFKYVTGSAHQDTFMNQWNENSFRYITKVPEFYTPNKDEWRSYPENVKQGSGEPLPDDVGQELTESIYKFQQEGERLYEEAMEKGVAPELARLFLPAYGMYVTWRWSASLEGIGHFLSQRLANDSQYEIQLYAKAVYDLVEPHFEHSLEALVDTD